LCQKSTSYFLRDELPEDDSFELLLLLLVLTLPLLLRLLPPLLLLADPLLLLLGLEVLAAGADCLEGAEDCVLAAGADCLVEDEVCVLAAGADCLVEDEVCVLVAGADLLTDPSGALRWVDEVCVCVLCAGAEPELVLLLTVEPDLEVLCAAEDCSLEVGVEADLLLSVLTEAVPLELLPRLDWTLAPIASPSLL